MLLVAKIFLTIYLTWKFVVGVAMYFEFGDVLDLSFKTLALVALIQIITGGC